MDSKQKVLGSNPGREQEKIIKLEMSRDGIYKYLPDIFYLVFLNTFICCFGLNCYSVG